MIPTAEQLLDQKFNEPLDTLVEPWIKDIIIGSMINFTELHVTAALKEAAKNAYVDEFNLSNDMGTSHSVNKNSILRSYPLTLIK